MYSSQDWASYMKHQRYRKKYKNELIRCSSCYEKMKFHAFEKHVLKAHRVNALYKCPYCLGKVEWKKGQKMLEKNQNHLVTCLLAFMVNCRVPVMEETVAAGERSLPAENDAKLVVCGECRDFCPNSRQMNGRNRDRTSEYVGLYDYSRFKKPDWWKTELRLFDESRGMYDDIIGMFRRMSLPEQDPNHLKFYHLMVRHDVFPTFLNAMENIKDEIALLPYGCLCDGLGPDHITHRHMILACTLESKFEQVWKKEVRFPLKTEGKRCKNSVRIKDAFHLANCIQYVSQHKASCDGVVIRDELNENKVQMSHFYLDRHLTPHGLAIMCLLFEGGMEKLLMQQNITKNVVDWVDEARKYHKKWSVAVKETGFKYLNCVIPLRRDLEPTSEKTSMNLNWMKHRQLYLRENAELVTLSAEDWYKYQVRKGNTFQTLSEEMYVYGRGQQNVMNQLTKREKVLKRKWDAEKEELCESMDAENKKLKMENDVLMREKEDWKRERDDLKRQIETLNHKLEMLHQKMENNELRQRLEAVERELEVVKMERDALKRELEAVKQELEAVKMERDDLKRELEAVKQELEAVKQELEAVKMERDDLKRELEAVKQELEAVKMERDDLKRELTAVKAELTAVKAELIAVKAERDELKRAK